MRSFRPLILSLLCLLALQASSLGLRPTSWQAPWRGSAPPGRMAFQSYGAAQGLGNLSIWCLSQDLDGFLWVGTEDGLFYYDGARFQGFGLEDGLPSAWIRALVPEEGHRLWIGTTHGLALREGSVIRVLSEASGLPKAEVFALAKDPQGRLWVAMDQGLYIQRKGQLSFDPAPSWAPMALARSLWVDPTAVFVTGQAHLYRYDLNSPKAAPVEVTGPWKERLDAIARDGQGRFWVRSRLGLWMRNSDASDFENLSSRLGPAAFDGHLQSSRQGEMLITSVEGLVRVRGQIWEVLDEKAGLPVPWANRATVDREGCLWVGGVGLHRSLAREAWRRHTQKDGLSGGVARAIIKDTKGGLWIGTTNGLCEARNGNWRLVPETQNQAFLSVVLAPDGALWMGGAPARLRRWVPGSQKWLEFPQPESTITNLLFGPDGTLWGATRREGLFCVKPKPGGYAFNFFQPPGSQPGERIQAMARGGENRVWMASNQGLLLEERGTWRRLGTAEGLPSADLLSVFERGNGDLWVSYQDRQGLSRFRFDGKRLQLLESVDAAKGFRARKTYFVREDAHGDLWMGTSQGIDLLQARGWSHFGTEDGLPGDDCNGSGFLAEPNGDVWVGTLGGLGRFLADHFQGEAKAPAAHLLSLRYGKSVLSAPFGAGLRIPRRDADVEFHFAGLTFLHEDRVQHQIRLQGLEEEWRLTDIRQARYTRLPPGRYRFEVRAGLGDGHWGPVASYAFQVLPAWWQSWWFRTLAILSGLGLVVLGFRLRLKALKRHNRELEDLVQSRTKDLAAANKTLQQFTVTDPLTGLRNRRFLDLTIEDDLAQVHRDYHTVRRGQQDRMPVNVDLLFLMVDIDHFKMVNDTYGHTAGDLVLQQFRDRLLEAVRDTDTVIRWGGEEFLIEARNADRSQAERLADRILRLVRDTPFSVGDGQFITKTCSLGFAAYPLVPELAPEAVTWQKVVEAADRCLYAAKRSGRDGWVGLKRVAGTDSLKGFLSRPDQPANEQDWDISTSFPDPKSLHWLE